MSNLAVNAQLVNSIQKLKAYNNYLAKELVRLQKLLNLKEEQDEQQVEQLQNTILQLNSEKESFNVRSVWSRRSYRTSSHVRGGERKSLKTSTGIPDSASAQLPCPDWNIPERTLLAARPELPEGNDRAIIST